MSALTEDDLDAPVAWMVSLKPVKHQIPERVLTAETKALVNE